MQELAARPQQSLLLWNPGSNSNFYISSCMMLGKSLHWGHRICFLIQLNVSNKGYYLLSLYSSPEQATKSMPKTFFFPFPFLPLTIISRPLLARLHYGTPTCLHVTMQGIERALKPLPLGSKQVLPAQKDTTQAVGITLEGVTFLRDSGCFVKLWS